MHRFFTGLILLLCLAMPTVAHDGPHGGELYCDSKHTHHAELCLDTKAGKANIYILDKKAKDEVGIEARSIKVFVKGIEKPLEFAASSRDGKSALFVLSHDRFKSKLKPSEVKMEIVLAPGKPAVVFNPEHDDD